MRPSTVPSPAWCPAAAASHSSPGRHTEGCAGLPNDFRLMAVLLQKCPAALAPGPLPPPFAEEKTPTRAPNTNTADHGLGRSGPPLDRLPDPDLGGRAAAGSP